MLSLLSIMIAFCLIFSQESHSIKIMTLTSPQQNNPETKIPLAQTALLRTPPQSLLNDAHIDHPSIHTSRYMCPREEQHLNQATQPTSQIFHSGIQIPKIRTRPFPQKKEKQKKQEIPQAHSPENPTCIHLHKPTPHPTNARKQSLFNSTQGPR